MKQNHPKNITVQAAAEAKAGTPTLLEFADTIHFELASSVNLPVKQKPANRCRETPKWVGKITDGFKRTILKPVLKLKQKRKMDWQNYGKIIGVLVDRATERSDAGRKSPETGILGGAQSFGVTESATVNPKVCAPGGQFMPSANSSSTRRQILVLSFHQQQAQVCSRRLLPQSLESDNRSTQEKPRPR